MTEKLPRDMTENELRYHCAALGDEIERLTAENERLRRQLGHCPNTSDGHHDWMMYLVGPDGQRLGTGSREASHGATAVFCQNCGAAC